MAKRVAIVQSNYIPWKGYFDLINSVDEFILFDDGQYTKRDWRNRNMIKTPQGPFWLTIPVQVKGKFFQKISETKISDAKWSANHWKSIQHHYAKAHYFHQYEESLKELYLNCKETFLSQINYQFIQYICALLGIKTVLSFSSNFEIVDGKNERLIHLCKQAKATEYISGPSAKCYLDPVMFEQNGLRLSFMDYSDYPIYRQCHPPFIHEVSILDLILCEGPHAVHFMKTFSKEKGN